MKVRDKRQILYRYCEQFKLSDCDAGKCLLYDKWVGKSEHETHCRAPELCTEKELDEGLRIIGIDLDVKKDPITMIPGQMSFEDFPWFMPNVEGFKNDYLK